VGSTPAGRNPSENAVLIGKNGFYLVHFQLTHFTDSFQKYAILTWKTATSGNSKAQ
jgi:hypothetical protein